MPFFAQKIRGLARIKNSFAPTKSGETLLEAIVAVSILLIVLGPASALYVGSIRTVAVNRNNLVASSLAEEGLEVFLNIRDTNLLKFSSKKTDCWNTKPDPAITLKECDKLANKIGDTEDATPKLLKLMFDPSALRWSVATGADPAPQVVSESDMEKYRVRSDSALDSDPECPTNAPNCHVHTGLYFLASPEVDAKCPCPRGALSPFYRLITVEYLDLEGNNTYPAMKVTSKVKYQAGSSLREVKRVTGITNQSAL